MRRISRPSITSARALLVLLGASGCASAARPTSSAPASARDSVSVGYGTQATRDLTGSVSSVSGDVARRSTPTSVTDMVDGRFSGVEVRRLPTGGMSVRIRGQHSIKGDGEPLYVLDGIPQHSRSGGVLDDIDPRSVKSIEVLKDAGATAIYGARGANGVILITTIRPE